MACDAHQDRCIFVSLDRYDTHHSVYHAVAEASFFILNCFNRSHKYYIELETQSRSVHVHVIAYKLCKGEPRAMFDLRLHETPPQV